MARVVLEQLEDDVALARDDGQACVQVFFVRAGRLIGREYFVLEGTGGEQDEAVLEAFDVMVSDRPGQLSFVLAGDRLPCETSLKGARKAFSPRRRGA